MMRLLHDTADCILHVVGDTSTQVTLFMSHDKKTDWYTKRLSLSAIYASAGT
jgi:ubiquinone biosynthesis protein COQ9